VLNQLVALVNNPQFMTMLLAGIAAAATVMTLAMPLVSGDSLSRRMRTVAIERDKIRTRERERLARESRIDVRRAPKVYMKSFVERLDLAKHFGTEDAREKLTMAGFRGQAPMVAFLFFRFVTPVVLFSVTVFYLFVIGDFQQPAMIRVGLSIAAAYIGIKLPELYIKNLIQKRQQSIKRAFPDALDLMLICVESGMSIEMAFRRVSQEIGSQSVPLAEELTLVNAEISYLQDRRTAYDNLGIRTGLESVKSVVTALIQAEKYGTPIGTALRVLAQESRDMRMAEAEKKAAALPPKLTVPMILFFLPILFVVILGPAGIQISGLK
jgi:tight adherence protein C